MEASLPRARLDCAAIAVRGRGDASDRRRPAGDRASGSRRSTPSSRTTGPSARSELLERVIERARRVGAHLPFSGPTRRTSTRSRSSARRRIPGDHDARAPASARSSAGTRWRWCCAPTRSPPSSAATSRATSRRRRSTRSASTTSGTRRPTTHGGDLVYIQGHSSPGIYARAFLEGRLTEEQLDNFRQEVDGDGLLVLPAPVADAGLLAVPDRVDGPRPAHGDLPGALHEVPARPRHRRHRRAARSGRSSATARWTSPSRWARSRSPAASSLDNLIFVVNCNLQRLDGPVRGNGKIIQELETIFRGAGWNVIKVIWGARWDPLLARRPRRACSCSGWRRPSTASTRRYKSRDGAYVREHFFGTYPELRELVADMSDDEIWRAEPRRPRPAQGLRRVRRGGDAHGPADGDPRQDDQGLRDGRGRRGPEHHPPAEEDERARRCSRSATASSIAAHRRGGRASVRVLQAAPTTRPRCTYLRERREALGGCLPQRRARRAEPLDGARSSTAFERPARGHRRARDLDDDGVRPDPRHAAARQADRPARRADRPRRVAHVRHGGHVPPARDLSARSASSTSPRTPSS